VGVQDTVKIGKADGLIYNGLMRVFLETKAVARQSCIPFHNIAFEGSLS